jgi:hypothetical protein
VSIDVLREVLNHSRARGTDRLVLITLAEAADPRSGVTWLPILPPKSSKADPTKCIAHRANCSKREVIRSIQNLEELLEIEVRKAQRAQRRINVYRVAVGTYRDAIVDYDDLPFELSEPFGRGDNLAPRNRADSASLSGPDGTPRGDEGGTRRGDELAPHGVRANAGARREPSEDPAAEPSERTPRGSSLVAGGLAGEELELLVPAAASSTEAVSIERAAALLARLRGWDAGSLKVVEPLLGQLPAREFVAAVERTLARRNVENPAGLFVFLLRTAIDEWRREQTAQRLSAWDAMFGEQGIEQVKRTDPERYVLAWAQAPIGIAPLPGYAVLPHLLDYLFEFVDDVDERRRLADLYDRVSQQAPSIAAIRDWILVAIERRRYPRHEVIETVRTLAPEHPELIAFADQVAAGGAEAAA